MNKIRLIASGVAMAIGVLSGSGTAFAYSLESIYSGYQEPKLEVAEPELFVHEDWPDWIGRVGTMSEDLPPRIVQTGEDSSQVEVDGWPSWIGRLQ